MTEVEYDRSCVGCEMRRIHRQADEVSYILSSLPASSPLRVAIGADIKVSLARTRSVTSHDILQRKSLLASCIFEGVSTVLVKLLSKLSPGIYAFVLLLLLFSHFVQPVQDVQSAGKKLTRER